MAGMSDLAVALAKLKAAKDIAESMVGLNDAATLKQKQIEFQSQLLDAGNAAFAAHEERAAMLDRIRELEKELVSLKTWESKKERYQLVSLAPNIVAYAPKESVSATEAPHYLCANCFASGKESFLQQTTRGPYFDKYVCNTCKEELPINKGTPPVRTARPDRGGGWMSR